MEGSLKDIQYLAHAYKRSGPWFLMASGFAEWWLGHCTVCFWKQGVPDGVRFVAVNRVGPRYKTRSRGWLCFFLELVTVVRYTQSSSKDRITTIVLLLNMFPRSSSKVTLATLAHCFSKVFIVFRVTYWYPSNCCSLGLHFLCVSSRSLLRQGSGAITVRNPWHKIHLRAICTFKHSFLCKVMGKRLKKASISDHVSRSRWCG